MKLSSGGFGGSAREIAEAFLDSPLMTHLGGGKREEQAGGEDEEEVGSNGLSGLSDVAPSESDKINSLYVKDHTRGGRDHSEWLGDYGPSHTRTVKSTDWDKARGSNGEEHPPEKYHHHDDERKRDDDRRDDGRGRW